jgi:hypothetical protein
MKTSLTKGMTPQQKQEFTLNFKASALFRERLSTLLNEKEETKRRAARASTAFESPSWAYQQAYALGYESAIFEVISLLSSNLVEKT